MNEKIEAYKGAIPEPEREEPVWGDYLLLVLEYLLAKQVERIG